MALIVADRVQETTTTTGTGTYTLAGAKDGYQSFAAVGDGNTCYYAITDGTDWETGIGTFTLSGTTLARTTIIESSNSGAAVNWGAGSKDIFVTAPADKTLLVGRNLYADNPSSATMPSATGTNAVAIGDNSTASGSNSFAFGTLSVASASSTFAAGYDAVSSGGQSFAFGDNVNATGQFSFCTGGGNATASGQSSIAMGYGATASAINAVSIARNTDATGSGSLAIGYNAQAISNSNATALTNSRASGADSFAAAIANNSSSYGATGSNSVAIGRLSKATGTYSIAIGGSTNLAQAIEAYCFGSNCTVTQSQGVAIGSRATVYSQGKMAYSSSRFAGNGDGQAGTFVLMKATTDGTATVLSTTAGTAGSLNQIILPNKSAYSFSGTIIARESATDGSDYASWEIKGALLRDANAASTVLGNGIVNKLYATSGASAWAVALSADTTNGGLKVEVTGAAATNIRWVATVNTSEVTYA